MLGVKAVDARAAAVVAMATMATAGHDCQGRRVKKLSDMRLASSLCVSDAEWAGGFPPGFIPPPRRRSPGLSLRATALQRRSSAVLRSSVEATLVGRLLPLFSQYRTNRG